MANELQAASAIILINPASYANTAAASSGWIFTGDFGGDLVCTQQVGAVTGSITGSFDTAQSSTGASAASVNFFNEGAFTAVSAANNLQVRTVSCNALGGWIRYRPTVVTGPALLAVTISGIKRAGN